MSAGIGTASPEHPAGTGAPRLGKPDQFAGKRIALIGGAGFIGHHMALHLRAMGAQVEVVDSLQVNNLLQFTSDANKDQFSAWARSMLNERIELLNGATIPLVTQDARDYHGLSHTLARFKPQVIVHLAAVSHAGKANKDPYHTFDHSLRTLENALDYARHGVEHFIYFSSSMAYGDFKSEQVAETHPLEPIGIYGALKASGEFMVRAYGQVFNLPYTTVRPSALYGERCVSRRVAQIFLENAVMGKPISIDGDGSDRLDFTYIEDLVHGVVQVLKAGPKGETFNLTYGSARSIKDLVNVLQKHFPKLEVKHVTRDALMPHRGTLDVSKARRLIGYDPKNPLEVGYPKYIEWFKARVASMPGR